MGALSALMELPAPVQSAITRVLSSGTLTNQSQACQRTDHLWDRCWEVQRQAICINNRPPYLQYPAPSQFIIHHFAHTNLKRLAQTVSTILNFLRSQRQTQSDKCSSEPMAQIWRSRMPQSIIVRPRIRLELPPLYSQDQDGQLRKRREIAWFSPTREQRKTVHCKAN